MADTGQDDVGLWERTKGAWRAMVQALREPQAGDDGAQVEGQADAAVMQDPQQVVEPPPPPMQDPTGLEPGLGSGMAAQALQQERLRRARMQQIEAQTRE